MINPPSTFGQPEPTAEAPEPEPEQGRRPRTVLVVAAAGVVALAVLGGAAALVLTGNEDPADLAAPTAPVAPVEPSVVPTASAVAPLPTAAVRGRNVFLPLVADESGGGGEADAVDPGASSASGGSDTDPAAESTAVPTAFPTAASGGSVALPVAPRPEATSTVTETVEVPGPVRTVPGPTATVTTPPRTVEVQVPGATFEALGVEVEGLPGAFTATFTVDYGDDVETYEDLEAADTFGRDDEFQFVSYDGTVLTFKYVSSLFNISVTPLT